MSDVDRDITDLSIQNSYLRERLEIAEGLLERWQKHDRDEERTPDDQPRLADEWEELLRDRDFFLSGDD